ncbi:MAG TPA: rRNA adenine methyltransferase [Chryseobacterium sp.]|nr:rRNA adenine methyltransferase [Chryseobacterium sp.]
MEYNQNNKVVQFCTQGMELEGLGDTKAATDLFLEAWSIASTDFEKFTAAHYVARHQNSITDKLHWDNVALHFALQIESDTIKAVLPSLYLNIGKCHEDLNNFKMANVFYEKGLSLIDFLSDDGYGKMIKTGIMNAMGRMKYAINYSL